MQRGGERRLRMTGPEYVQRLRDIRTEMDSDARYPQVCAPVTREETAKLRQRAHNLGIKRREETEGVFG